MYNRVIGVVLAVGAVVFVLLLAGVGSNALTDDPPAVSPYASAVDTTVPATAATFVIDAVIFGDGGSVQVTNVGEGTGTLDGHWLCQFPAYVELSGSLAPGESAVFEDGFGALADASGEVGLYTSAGFDDPTSIISYVEWGEPGHARSGTAVEAGVWTAESAVDATGAFMIVANDIAPTSAAGWSTG